MSTQKPQPKDKANEPEGHDDLTLDPETVKDLEPKDDADEMVRGGLPAVQTGALRCGGGTGGTKLLPAP